MCFRPSRTNWTLMSVPTYHPRRWENPLMGWTSTADPLSSVQRMSMEFARRVTVACAVAHNVKCSSLVRK